MTVLCAKGSLGTEGSVQISSVPLVRVRPYTVLSIHHYILKKTFLRPRDHHQPPVRAINEDVFTVTLSLSRNIGWHIITARRVGK